MERSGDWLCVGCVCCFSLMSPSFTPSPCQDTQKAKQFLPFLQRAGRSEAVVEYVFSGSRLKLYMPKETCLITFLLAGGLSGVERGEPFPSTLHKLLYLCLSCSGIHSSPDLGLFKEVGAVSEGGVGWRGGVCCHQSEEQ